MFHQCDVFGSQRHAFACVAAKIADRRRGMHAGIVECRAIVRSEQIRRTSLIIARDGFEILDANDGLLAFFDPAQQQATDLRATLWHSSKSTHDFGGKPVDYAEIQMDHDGLFGQLPDVVTGRGLYAWVHFR